jgi:hypothetical protein
MTKNMRFLLIFTIIAVITQFSLQGEGECTEGSCLFCMTDGSKKWCAKCGNGTYLSSTEPGEGKCIGKLEIENCYQPDPYDPTKPEKCGKCKNGYYLSKNKRRCFKYVDFKCDLPYMWDTNRLCGGCKYRYIDDSYQKCSGDKDIPEHCYFGDI